MFSFIKVGRFFTFLIVCFEAPKFLIWWSSNYLLSSFVACTFDVISKKSLHALMSQRFTPMFSYKRLKVLAFKFRSLIDFEIIFASKTTSPKICQYRVWFCECYVLETLDPIIFLQRMFCVFVLLILEVIYLVELELQTP